MTRGPQLARRFGIHGIVQGVGLRPFVFRLATQHRLAGWVANAASGVELHVEGTADAIEAFTRDLRDRAPSSASISDLRVSAAALGGFEEFSIRESGPGARPRTHISPDLPVCEECLTELLDGSSRRRDHPYITCTNCGPRYSIITALPYDRARTTMAEWPMCEDCAREYRNPANRRFHAQPIACRNCGPDYRLLADASVVARDEQAIHAAAGMIRDGLIVAVKGLGGYHLACDAALADAVLALRQRKYRKEKPFAVMAQDLATARALVELSADAEAALVSSARPIVLAPARVDLAHVAPDTRELGVMLPYAPIHHLLFASGAPPVIVLTSGNRASDPIAYEDPDAVERLTGIADAFLVGERRIARRVDDSVVRAGTLGPQILRRARGYAPGAVARLPLSRPTLALGADLKNAITLVVDGAAFVSQHIGDLDHAAADRAFQETIHDLLTMYEVDTAELVVVHDLHPQYVSTRHAVELPAVTRHAVQHHRAHIASVMAERGAFEQRVLGVAFDGTGYGDDGTIWGGEFFVGSIAAGLGRVGHLRAAALPGGDAAARHPVQAAAGFLAELDGAPDMSAAPFDFPSRYRDARKLVEQGIRTFRTTSAGRLFDTAAALLGFTRASTFEGQAAMWLEHLAGREPPRNCPPLPVRGDELDFRPLLEFVIASRIAGRRLPEIARAFHLGLAYGIVDAARMFCEAHDVDVVVLSGGVFQNELLVDDVTRLLGGSPIQLWMNRAVPPNDGGISLGQAALMMSLHRAPSTPRAPAPLSPV